MTGEYRPTRSRLSTFGPAIQPLGRCRFYRHCVLDIERRVCDAVQQREGSRTQTSAAGRLTRVSSGGRSPSVLAQQVMLLGFQVTFELIFKPVFFFISLLFMDFLFLVEDFEMRDFVPNPNLGSLSVQIVLAASTVGLLLSHTGVDPRDITLLTPSDVILLPPSDVMSRVSYVTGQLTPSCGPGHRVTRGEREGDL